MIFGCTNVFGTSGIISSDRLVRTLPQSVMNAEGRDRKGCIRTRRQTSPSPTPSLDATYEYVYADHTASRFRLDLPCWPWDGGALCRNASLFGSGNSGGKRFREARDGDQVFDDPGRFRTRETALSRVSGGKAAEN
jgi:hypothetical protein